MDLLASLDALARLTPDKPLLRFEGQALGYGQMQAHLVPPRTPTGKLQKFLLR